MQKHPIEKHLPPAATAPLTAGAWVGDEGAAILGQQYRNFTVVEEDGWHYLLSKKAILTLNLTPVCNANCSFCYNGITFFASSDRRRLDLEEFDRTLAFCVRGGLQHVSFSGGEPTLVPSVLMEGLARCASLPGFKRVHTNGSQILKASSGRPLVDRLLAAGMNSLSISRVAADRAANGAAMALRTEDVLSDADIRLLCGLVADLRLSCFVHPLGVAAPRAALDFMNWGLALGVRRFVFRLSSSFPNQHALPSAYASGNFELADWPTLAFREAFEREGFETRFERQELDHDLFILERDGVEVSVDRSTDVLDPDHKIRRLVVMPNGVTYTSWLHGASHLFPEDGRRIRKHAERMAKQGSGHFPAERARPRAPNLEERKSDLHLHSTVSDGKIPPSAVIGALLEAGVTRAVFTEHNGIHPNLDALIEYASHRGLDISLPGTEVSVKYRNTENGANLKFHVLAFGQGVRSAGFRSWIDRANLASREHFSALHSTLRRGGLALRPAEEVFQIADPVEALCGAPVMFSRTALAADVARALGVTIEEAKARYVPALPAEHKERYTLCAHELMERAQQAGCVTIMAHPGWVRDLAPGGRAEFGDVLDAIIDLHRVGMDGVEVYHKHNTPEQRHQLVALARLTDMLVSGGSDYHGRPSDVLGVEGCSSLDFARLQRACALKAVAAANHERGAGDRLPSPLRAPGSVRNASAAMAH